MHPRLAEEWADLVSLYPDALHHEAPERLEVMLDLEPGLYTAARIPVGVLVPPGYRATAPDGFLLPNGLQLSNGGSLPVSDAAGMGMPGWWLVSFHFTDERGETTWRPTADPARGDNMISYLSSIEAFLAGGCN